ncbi:MAG: hypothetical protein ACO1OB_03675 [Archangium sp.]
MRWISLLPLVSCLALADAGGALVNDAKRQLDDLEPEAALKTLDAAEKQEGNARATVLELHLLRGIAFGTLGKDAKTRDAFRKLLMLDPTAKLPLDLPPRVQTPFFEAREWCANNGPLTAVPSAEVADGEVKALVLTVQKDVLRLAKSARFVVGEKTVEVPLVQGVAKTPVSGATVSWSAEVLGDRKAVLLAVASRTEGKTTETPTPVEPGAVVVTPSQPIEVQGAWRRPLGGMLLGAGVAAAGIGVVFGVLANGSRMQVSNAERDSAGRVVSITQREANALEASAQTQATVANVLFVSGGVLAATGVVFLIIGPSEAPVARLAPAAGGVVLSGTF